MLFKLSTLDTGNAPAGTVTTLPRVSSFSPSLASKDSYRERNDGVNIRRERGRRLMECKLVVEVLDTEVQALFQVLGNASLRTGTPLFLWWDIGTIATPSYPAIWLKPSGTWFSRFYCWIENPRLDSSSGKWFKISFGAKSAWENTT
jgi:hypothetical protein